MGPVLLFGQSPPARAQRSGLYRFPRPALIVLALQALHLAQYGRFNEIRHRPVTLSLPRGQEHCPYLIGVLLREVRG